MKSLASYARTKARISKAQEHSQTIIENELAYRRLAAECIRLSNGTARSQEDADKIHAASHVAGGILMEMLGAMGTSDFAKVAAILRITAAAVEIGVIQEMDAHKKRVAAP